MTMLIFTVKPVVSWHWCTVCCKCFLNLHMACINIYCWAHHCKVDKIFLYSCHFCQSLYGYSCDFKGAIQYGPIIKLCTQLKFFPFQYLHVSSCIFVGRIGRFFRNILQQVLDLLSFSFFNISPGFCVITILLINLKANFGSYDIRESLMSIFAHAFVLFCKFFWYFHHLHP